MTLTIKHFGLRQKHKNPEDEITCNKNAKGQR